MTEHPHHTEIIVYLKEVKSRVRALFLAYERKNNTIKTKAARGTLSFLSYRVDKSLTEYEEDRERYKGVDLQIHKMIFEDVLIYWEKMAK